MTKRPAFPTVSGHARCHLHELLTCMPCDGKTYRYMLFQSCHGKGAIESYFNGFFPRGNLTSFQVFLVQQVNENQTLYNGSREFLRGIKIWTARSYNQKLILLEHIYRIINSRPLCRERYACCVFLFTQMSWRQRIFPAEAIATLSIIN